VLGHWSNVWAADFVEAVLSAPARRLLNEKNNRSANFGEKPPNRYVALHYSNASHPRDMEFKPASWTVRNLANPGCAPLASQPTSTISSYSVRGSAPHAIIDALPRLHAPRKQTSALALEFTALLPFFREQTKLNSNSVLQLDEPRGRVPCQTTGGGVA